ncbi:MAG: DEAD/DEAH box helicase [Synergistaceae bacterium]
MLILHTFYINNSFYIWGENSFEDDTIFPLSLENTINHIPWSSSYTDLSDALKRMEIRNKKKAVFSDFQRLYFKLPSVDGIPIPSSTLLGNISLGSNEPKLLRFSVDAQEISYDEFCEIAQLIRECDSKLPVSGILFANDTLFIKKALDYALTLAYRGLYIPDMSCDDDKYTALWSPIYLARNEDEHQTLVNLVPPIFCSVSLNDDNSELSSKSKTTDLILSGLLDQTIRESCKSGTRGKKVDSANPHELWVRALTWPRSPLDMWEDAMRGLHKHIRSWSKGLREITGQPWRLYMKLEEPTDEEELYWTLSWHLQSTKDYSLIIPASSVWSPSEVDKGWFEREKSNPRKYLLQILGNLSSFIPAIARSMRCATPESAKLSSNELFDFLQTYLPSIMEQGIFVKFPTSWGNIADRPRLAVKATLADNALSLSSSQISLNDLLEVNWSVTLGDEVLTEREIQSLRELKSPLTKIRGKWVLLYRSEIEKVTSSFKKLPTEIARRDALMFSFSNIYKDVPIASVVGSKWLDVTKDLLTGKKEIEIEEQPEGLNAILRPYQLKGFSWLSWLTKLGLGGCLADDMGLGKTIQTLALIQKARSDGENRPSLLICPTSVIENWKREAERFLPNLPIFIHHGVRRSKGDKFKKYASQSALVITSYSLLHRDNELLKNTEWCGVVLDEAQNIKNPDARQSRSAREIPADWHIALTGTPVENHVGDMWSIMEFLMPGLLPNKTRFKRDFLRPMQSGEMHVAEKIRKMIAPFVLRRLKSDKTIISDLPDKIETKVFCNLSKEQATLYNSVLENLKKNLSNSQGIKRKGIILSTITALKQVCNHPALYMKDSSDLSGRSGKISRLTEIAEELITTQDRVLIFTQYAEMGKLIKAYLQETFGKEVLFLHGGVPKEKRDEMVARFQEDADAPLFFVLSLKAGGSGINLTRANHVIMFDRWWNPAVEQQAVDRAYRIGQQDNVQVHYFCCKGTLEERIEELILAKKSMADAIIKSEESIFTELTDSEISKLFALGSEAIGDIK